MNTPQSIPQLALALARRSVVQGMPSKALTFAGEHASHASSLAKGYIMRPGLVSEKLHEQQQQMATGLRRQGHERAAQLTESRLQGRPLVYVTQR